jgi:hypothetical protein
MADTRPPQPVKYFIAVLYRDPAALDRARQSIIGSWGSIDFEGADHPFDVTGYYDPEMGPGLLRRLLSLETLREPTLIVDMKLRCNEIETALAADKKRTVNLDAGYLDHNKVLLASAKEAGQKIYLDKGIYADLAGRYKAGKYRPFEWSFPDFHDGRYDSELLKMRSRYLEQIREWKAGQSRQSRA